MSGFLTGVVSLVDKDGNRVDTPNQDGDHAPVELQLGSTMVATKTTNGALTRVTINAAAGGGGEGGIVVALDTHDDFRDLDITDVPDGTVFTFQNPVGTFVYEDSTGAGQADDDASILRLDAVSLGSPGRAYNVNSPIVPTLAALRLAVSGKHKTVQVLCRETAGDGGDGFFDDVTGVLGNADDDGIFIHAGARIFKRQNSGKIDIRWYGVLPNLPSRAATNTTKFNAMMAVYSGTPGVQGNGPTIHCPRGVYYFARGISLNIHDVVGLKMTGDGAAAGDTCFQYGIDGTGSYFAHAFVSLVGSLRCRFDRIYFYAKPLGSSGGVVPGTGTSAVAWIVKGSSHTDAGVEHYACAHNHFEECHFHGGLVAGFQYGDGGGGGLGIDTNLDQNSFHNCEFNFNDGCGLLLTDANTAYTKISHCGFGTNGLWSIKQQKYVRTTVADHCAFSNCGILASLAANYHVRLEAGFGRESFVLRDMTFELAANNGVASASGPVGGVIPCGSLVLKNVSVASNDNPDMGGGLSMPILDCNAPMSYVLDNVIFTESSVTHEARVIITCAGGLTGPKTLRIGGAVQLYGGATMNVGANIRWDGTGVVHMNDSADASPTYTRPQWVNADIDPVAAIAGSKVNPNFVTQALVAGSGVFSGQRFATGAAGNTVQDIIRGNAGQTAKLSEWQTSGAAVVASVDKDGGMNLSVAGVPIFFGPYTGGAGFAGCYIGVVPGGSNWLFLTNGTTALWNAPDASGTHEFSAGFNTFYRLAKGNGSLVVDINHAGTPEASLTGQLDTLCHDTTNHNLYLKMVGAGNTGWKQIEVPIFEESSSTITAPTTTSTSYDDTILTVLPGTLAVGDTVEVMISAMANCISPYRVRSYTSENAGGIVARTADVELAANAAGQYTPLSLSFTHKVGTAGAFVAGVSAKTTVGANAVTIQINSYQVKVRKTR